MIYDYNRFCHISQSRESRVEGEGKWTDKIILWPINKTTINYNNKMEREVDILLNLNVMHV